MVAEIDGRVTGVTQLIVRDSMAELPECLKSGIGRALLDWAKAEANRAGATALFVEVDLYVVDFYRRCGAVDVGLVPSSLFPGRFLPRLKFPLSAQSPR
jgi:N-acetylglutamate synthase-like GNAT family acetyltransferase